MALTSIMGIERAREAFHPLRLTRPQMGRDRMSKARKWALALAGAALFGASPAAAQTVVMFFAPSHLMIGYIIYGDDGHICEQYGSTSNMTSVWHVDGDC
jgi:hypothetical protein